MSFSAGMTEAHVEIPHALTLEVEGIDSTMGCWPVFELEVYDPNPNTQGWKSWDDLGTAL
jgi:hypothetical protein